MNILVTNVHSARNAGDRALLEATLTELQAQFPGYKITIAMNDPRSYGPERSVQVVSSFTHWFQDDTGAWRRWAMLAAPWLLLQSLVFALIWRWTRRRLPILGAAAQRRLLHAYADADLIVSCPGNFFFSGSGLGVPFLLAVAALAYGRLFGKPLYMMPQTIGPLRRRREQNTLRWLLQHVRVVLLRDEISAATVRAIGLRHPRCYVLPDIAFLYRGDNDLALLAQAQAELGGLARPLIGVTVINWQGHDRHHARPEVYEAAVAAALRAFLQSHGGAAILFPQVCGPSEAEDDRPPGRRIAEQLCSAGLPAVALTTEATPAQLQTAYGQMDIFLGTRLHSNIFALTAGTPVLAIAYQSKTHGVMQMLGLGDWVIDIQQATPEAVTVAVEKLWQERAALRTHLQRTLPEIQRQARQATAWIRADFVGLRPSHRRFVSCRSSTALRWAGRLAAPSDWASHWRGLSIARRYSHCWRRCGAGCRS
jgi:colanic acid/amylovoran biosynthesis protein